MNPTIFASISIALYLLTTGLITRSLVMHTDSETWLAKRLLIPLAITAMVFHGLTLIDIYSTERGVNFSFFNTAALVMLIVVFLLIGTAITKPVEKLGVFIFPLASLIVFLKITFPETVHLIKTDSWGMDVHIMVSILSYSLLNIAAVQALLLAFQDWQLRRRRPNRLVVTALPPLQTMESLLFQLIGVGFTLLTVSLATGFVFLEDIFAQHLAHKTVFAILAWIAFAVLLLGRVRYGWRGQTAIRWTLVGFVSLMLAYFGTKMVLELILKRNYP